LRVLRQTQLTSRSVSLWCQGVSLLPKFLLRYEGVSVVPSVAAVTEYCLGIRVLLKCGSVIVEASVALELRRSCVVKVFLVPRYCCGATVAVEPVLLWNQCCCGAKYCCGASVAVEPVLLWSQCCCGASVAVEPVLLWCYWREYIKSLSFLVTVTIDAVSMSLYSQDVFATHHLTTYRAAAGAKQLAS
ncbi:hypothetical protein OTU49_000264, partial [Cherax quadricarinatus]